MESRVDKALARRLQGYNCAQAVVCTYCDLFGMEEQLAYKVAEAFGTGMGGMQHTCGAASGAFMLAGLANGDGVLGNKETRGSTYALVKQMAKAFEEANHHLMCADIIQDVDATGKRKRSCEDCIVNSAKIIEDLLLKK